MFGTIRYVGRNKDGDFEECETGVVDGVSTNKPQHLACDNCRVKKIRCNGRRAGCSRCKTLHLSCTYSDPKLRKGGRKRPSTANSSSHDPVNDPMAVSIPDLDTQGSVPEHSPFDSDPIWANDFDWQLQDDMKLLATPGGQQLGSGSRASAAETRAEPQQQGSSCRSSSTVDRHSAQIGSIPWHSLLHASPFTAPSSGDDDITSCQRPDRQPPTAMQPPCMSQPQCSCLPMAVFLLDELDSRDSSSRCEGNLDSILSTYNDVLSRCEQMLECCQCRAKSENMMVLNMVFEKLVGLCDILVDSYFHLTTGQEGGLSKGSRIGSLPEGLSLTLGEYELERAEWDTVVRVLAIKKISDMRGFLEKMTRVTSLAQRQARLSMSEQRIEALARKLQSCAYTGNKSLGKHDV